MDSCFRRNDPGEIVKDHGGIAYGASHMAGTSRGAGKYGMTTTYLIRLNL